MESDSESIDSREGERVDDYRWFWFWCNGWVTSFVTRGGGCNGCRAITGHARFK